MEEKQDNGYDEILKTLESKSFRKFVVANPLLFKGGIKPQKINSMITICSIDDKADPFDKCERLCV